MSRTLYIASVATIASSLGAAGVLLNCSGADEEEPPDHLGSSALSLLQSNPLPGAIFTTLVDGARVNANIYAAKQDVYLDGGPGVRAPAGAAGLPEGDYYFQVTDPSGKDLLSTDHISCRKVHVSEAGVIDTVYAGTNYEWKNGGWEPIACQHAQGTDRDHGEIGAVTVQLFPYDDTPNAGGVYKVWMTRVDDYTLDREFVPQKKSDSVAGELWEPGNAHGFVPASSKTDNFRVNKKKPCDPDILTIGKFHDANANALQDSGEPDIEGWRMAVSDPVGAPNNYFTTATILADRGSWIVLEDQPDKTRETASYLDGTRLSAYPTADPVVNVTFEQSCGDSHSVAYGNVGLGEVTACKVYDSDADGQVDESEPAVSGWKMTLSGTDVTGAAVGPIVQLTTADEGGCTTFSGLMPGQYTVSEKIPTSGGWESTGITSQPVSIQSTLIDGVLGGTAVTTMFTNLCKGAADFDTKGFWHNKNGLALVTDADIEHANGLSPYSNETAYFDTGDEPFDGHFENGDPVSAMLGDAGDTIAAAGTARAEISHFLVDANATGDPREQLAQQLLAFIFNVEHALDDGSALVAMPDGSYKSASELIDEAIAIWSGGTPEQQHAMEMLLDGFNNDDAVAYVHSTPCAVSYP